MVIKATTDGVRLGRVRVKAVSRAAILVVDSKKVERWIPNSQTHDDSEIYDKSRVGDEGELVICQWLAEKLGIE